MSALPPSRLNLLVLLILFFSAGPAANSQQEAPPDTTFIYHIDSLEYELDEVVITGTRVAKKIIDIPYSVTRINNLSYRFNDKIGVDDVLAAVPGMFMQSRYGNHDVRISIRGFGSKSNSGIRGVRILLDDIPESEPDGQTRIEAIDFNSIGRIEVVKGNSSSLYTNAPGGVVNFINDITFPSSYALQFNQFGSFGLRRNGFKTGIRTNNYRLLTTYSYHNYDGYREHNDEYWHILNMVLETTPTPYSTLKILGYFVDGRIRLPGSLTREEFEEDPWQADQRSIDRDQKRISTKGRLGLRFNTFFGSKRNNELEVTSYATIKYFERTSREYRIINRYGLGLTVRYVNRTEIGGLENEFSVGGDLLFQPARTEYYKNLSGQKDDQLLQLMDEKISNSGFYVSDNFELVEDQMFLLLTARYDRVVYDLNNEIAQYLTGYRVFNAVTPKLALNYKITPHIAVYSSFGKSFDSPAKNELESLDPATLYNQDLKGEESISFELGLKGNVIKQEAPVFNKALFEVTFFNLYINNEIVPFEVYGDVFFRNAASTRRTGLEAGTEIKLFDDFELTVSYTFSEFNYRTYSAKTIEIDTTGNIMEDVKDFSGNIVPSVPVNNLYAALSYSREILRNFNGFARLSYRGVSGMWVDDANTAKTDAYNLVNSLLGFEIRAGNFNLLASGGLNNIFDVIYVGFTNTNSADRRFYEAGAPRNWFFNLNLGYSF